jgi:hypothetical protein
LTNQHVATFVDAQGTDGNRGEYHATINWGDGTAPDSATVITYNGAGKYTVTGSHHTYAKAGTFTVKTTIFHGNAATTATATGKVVVTAAAASHQPLGVALRAPHPADQTGARSHHVDHALAASLAAGQKDSGAGRVLANDAVHLRALHSPAAGITADADPFGAL